MHKYVMVRDCRSITPPPPDMPGLTTYPPFPEDIATAPLQVVDYQLIKAGDEGEIDKLWKAATELGFW